MLEDKLNNIDDDEGFPEAPKPPIRPKKFSYREAMKDTKSRSAIYLERLEDWNSEMFAYHNLFSLWIDAVSNERIDELEKRLFTLEQICQKAFFGASNEDYKNMFKEEYNLGDHIDNFLEEFEKDEIMKEMENNKEISMHQIVHYYKDKYGLNN